MWKGIDLRKGLDKGLDFVKKVTAAEIVLPSARRSDERFVFYSFSEAPADVSVFPPDEDCEESAFTVGSGCPTVDEVESNFPLEEYFRSRLSFRFKVEDSEFGHLWLDMLDGREIAPTFRGNIHLRVLLCPISMSAAGSTEIKKTPKIPPFVHPVSPPPCREELVRVRLEAEAAQVQAARDFASSNAKDAAVRRQDKLEAQSQLGAELDRWALTEQGKFKDVRSLLANVSGVLWANSGWVDVPIGELMMSEAAVKKAHRRAIILCHPDKHQKADAQQQYRADRIFDAINESYKVFTGIAHPIQN